MLRPRAFLLAIPLALALVPAGAPADEVIVAQPMTRRFPQGQFCALPVAMTFVAPTTSVRVTFTALEFVDDGSGNLTWTEQAIDNVTLATSAVVAAHFGGPPAFSASENCYIGDPTPVSYFHFNQAGATTVLKELCDDSPEPRGWDFTSGAYFSAQSGPRDVENDTDFAGGSIGLGDGSGTPAAGATASTSIVIEGLAVGTSYDLGAWWFANFVRFPHDTDYLTVSITSLGGTPIARRTWSGVKGLYR